MAPFDEADMGRRRIYVIGHKRPDTDSIVSAVAYAELLRRQGQEDIVAGRQGDPWPETQYILDRFAIPLPALVEDVRPRVSDVMTSRIVKADPNESVYQVGRRMRKRRIRAIPLVDGDGYLQGLITVQDFSRLLFEEMDPTVLDKIPLGLDNLLATLGAKLVVRAPTGRLRDKVMVGAMSAETMRERVESGILLVIGDRPDAQRVAIEKGVAALVVTGGLPVDDEIMALARERGVTIISSPHHTFTTARLLNMSIPVSSVMQTDVLTAHPDDLLDEVRPKLAQQRTVPVLGANGRLIGIVSQSDLLHPVRHGVFLVDHNERAQSVDGLEEAEILGIIDHHRIADVHTPAPIFFRNEVIGATSTIIAALYWESGIPIPPSIAGILLGGILTDTVAFRSPTCTPRDQEVGRHLAELAGVDLDEYAEEIFAVASNLSGRSLRQVLTTDFKEFIVDGARFGIGYLETTDRSQVDTVQDQLLIEMEKIRTDRGYAVMLFIVVDIRRDESEILIAGQEEAVAEAFAQKLASPHSIVLPGVVSRKKQVVPVLPYIRLRKA
jgi:manganese-dependent inorganic pyrophosphatase